MNEAQRLRCVELAASLSIRPDQVMQYAETFARFIASGKPSTEDRTKLQAVSS